LDIKERLKNVQELIESCEILGAQSARLDMLRRRLESGSLTVAVIGQFKRGKSALINAMLGEDLLPVGIVPVTSAVSKISYGDGTAAVSFMNGLVKNIKVDEIETYVNEQMNPQNALGVASVSLSLPSDFLDEGLILVDTPGVGSVHKNNSATAYNFVKESDAVVFVLSPDSPINEIELDFLSRTKAYAGKFFFAINKTDIVSEEELAAYTSYCSLLIKAVTDSEDVNLVPVSAKTGRGIAALREGLKKDLRQKTDDILRESTRLKLIDIIGGALSQIELYWKVLLMTPVVLRKTLADMEAKLLELEAESSALVHALEADRDIIIPGLDRTLRTALNEFKLKLSSSVVEIFGMDYHYELPPLEENQLEGNLRIASELGKEYAEETERLCRELSETMKNVLMYRNSDTFEVVDRVYRLNRVTRALRRMKRELEG